MYQLHRVFCATSWELEAERRAFGEAIGEINQVEAMSRGILYTPVSLVRMRDKRPYQYDVDENIRACRHYVLALSDGWGPPERNFQRDFQLARECSADPSLPMREVALLMRRPLEGSPRDPSLPKPDAEFATAAEFLDVCRRLLSEWLAALVESR
jgi:hypothetical protein